MFYVLFLTSGRIESGKTAHWGSLCLSPPHPHTNCFHHCPCNKVLGPFGFLAHSAHQSLPKDNQGSGTPEQDYCSLHFEKLRGILFGNHTPLHSVEQQPSPFSQCRHVQTSANGQVASTGASWGLQIAGVGPSLWTEGPSKKNCC